MATVDLTMTRGDSRLVDIAVTNTDGTARNLTGATLRLTVKHGYGDLDTDALFAYSGPATEPTLGTSVVVIPAGATTGLPPISVLVYDIELTESGGQVTTIQTGKLNVAADASIA